MTLSGAPASNSLVCAYALHSWLFRSSPACSVYVPICQVASMSFLVPILGTLCYAVRNTTATVQLANPHMLQRPLPLVLGNFLRCHGCRWEEYHFCEHYFSLPCHSDHMHPPVTSERLRVYKISFNYHLHLSPPWITLQGNLSLYRQLAALYLIAKVSLVECHVVLLITGVAVNHLYIIYVVLVGWCCW